MFKRVRYAFVKDTEFMKRIRNRHYAFWRDPNRGEINPEILCSTSPAEIWKEGKNWQRKLSNKYNSKEFAKKYNCKVLDLYWKGRNVKEIDFEKLPSYYVIKPTAGCGSERIWLMSNGVNLFDNQSWRKEEIIAAIEQILSREPTLEFLIEEFGRTMNGEYKIPADYKIFAFNGAIACIEVINRTAPKKGTQIFYDENWNELKAVTRTYPKIKFHQRPECLEEMLCKARELSKIYEIFVRIDFYATDKGAVLGEFTPTPSLGSHYTSYGSELLVSYWDKYCAGKI